ncbi:MAG: tyrosine-type recombinase/integrase [Thalassobaculum sp.]
MVTIKIKGVFATRSRHNPDIRYWYHRKTGQRVDAWIDQATGEKVTAEYGTAAFLARKEQLDRIAAGEIGAQARPAHVADRPPGSFGHLIRAYRASTEFQDKAPRTRRDYGRILEYLDIVGHLSVGEIDGPFIAQIREKAVTKHGRRFANYVLTICSVLFTFGIDQGLAQTNPAAGVKRVRRPRDARVVNRVWKPYEFEAVLAAAKADGDPGMVAALGLARYAALREGDVIVLARSARQGGWLTWRQGKTGEEHAVPERAVLTEILDWAQAAIDERSDRRKRKPGRVAAATTIVVGKRGRPYASEDGFRANFFKLIRTLTKAGKVEPGLTFHGLRSTAGTEAVEATGTREAARNLLGQTNLASTKSYVQIENRDAVGNVIRILERAGNDSAKPSRRASGQSAKPKPRGGAK